MATIDAPRFVLEVLSKAAAIVALTNQGVEVVTLAALVATVDDLRAARYTMEVASAYPHTAAVTNQGGEVLADGDGLFPASSDNIVAPRYDVEVAQKAPAQVGVTHQGVEVLLESDLGASADTVQAPRFSIEVLARRFTPLSGFTVPTGLLHYTHNWISGCTLESSYLTDVGQAAETVSEDRRQLQDRPRRVLDVAWDIRGIAAVDAFLVELRRYNQERMGVPLYPDTSEVSQTSASAQRFLYCDTTLRRFFPNGMIAIVEYSGVDGSVTRVQYKKIKEKLGNRLELTTNLDWTATAGTVAVFPLLYVHKVLDIGYEAITEHTFRVKAGFEEVYGKTALPPTASDTPSNFSEYAGRPIFDVEPNWASPLKVSLVREGSMHALGRGQEEDTRGERHRVHHGFNFQEERTRTWDILRFFDSRRGRLRAFWLTDRENLWTPVEINYVSDYISVAPLGDLAAFKEEMDYVGVALSDGTSVVREAVTIEEIAGTWRITLDIPFPVGYTASDIVRIGRARLTRNKSDTLKESWTTNTICSMAVETVELLEEKDVDFV